MKYVPRALAGLLACTMSTEAGAQGFDDATAERYRVAMKTARWTGPMLAANAETLPKGHFYTEPYFFDAISGGEHSPGTTGFYQYGLLEGFTFGFQPNFAFGTESPNRKLAVGDLKLLSTLRLTHFTPENRIPTVSIILQESVPIGDHDGLDPDEDGHGSGSFATEIGLNVQHYFLLGNGRLLRGRINLLKSFPHGADINGRSVYGTGPGFHGRAKPGSKSTMIIAVEYSLTREWVLALDVIREATNETTVDGRYGSGPLVRQQFAPSRHVGFAPAVEYNWSDRSGVLLGVWINPKGHNTPKSVIPAIAYSRFW